MQSTQSAEYVLRNSSMARGLLTRRIVVHCRVSTPVLSALLENNPVQCAIPCTSTFQPLYLACISPIHSLRATWSQNRVSAGGRSQPKGAVVCSLDYR